MTINTSLQGTLKASIDSLAGHCWKQAEEHGFHAQRKHLKPVERTIIEAALIATETSELIEHVREGGLESNPAHALEELADVVIRALDCAVTLRRILGEGLPTIGEAILAKMNRNAARGHLHGGKLQ